MSAVPGLSHSASPSHNKGTLLRHELKMGAKDLDKQRQDWNAFEKFVNYIINNDYNNW